MAGQLMLINPRRKRRTRRKMSALQRKYFGKRRRSSVRRRSSRPRATILAVNPRRRRRHHHSRSRRRVTMLAVNPRRRRHSRRHLRRTYRLRRNPVAGGSMSSLTNILIGGGVGALGGLGVNYLFGNITLPQSMQQGTTFYPFLKIGAAVLFGMGIGAVGGKRIGEAAAAGAVTIVLYNQLSSMIQQKFPNMQLGRYIAMRGVGRRRMMRLNGMRRNRGNMRGLGRRRGMRGMGYMNPARVVKIRRGMNGVNRYIGMRGLNGNLARFIGT